MRITFGRGRSRQTVTLPHASLRKDMGRDTQREYDMLKANIEERCLPPATLLARKGFNVYDGRR